MDIDFWGFLEWVANGLLDLLRSVGETIMDGFRRVADFFGNIIIWIGDRIGEFGSWLGERISEFGNFVGGFVGPIVQNALETFDTFVAFALDVIELIEGIVHIAALVVEIVLQAALKFVFWCMALVDLVIRILTAIIEAEPVAVPFMPQCVTAPEQFQICALWYVFDWTILAPGTPGQYIMPILVLGISVMMIEYVIKNIFKAIRWFQTIYEVT